MWVFLETIFISLLLLKYNFINSKKESNINFKFIELSPFSLFVKVASISPILKLLMYSSTKDSERAKNP